jgi:hypothetical protein
LETGQNQRDLVTQSCGSSVVVRDTDSRVVKKAGHTRAPSQDAPSFRIGRFFTAKGACPPQELLLVIDIMLVLYIM